MKRIIIVVLVLVIILGFLFWKFGPSVKTPLTPSNITLNFWGLWEDENLIRPVLDEYKKTHPNITISYIRHSSVNFRTKVQTQIRAGTGPDIFSIHSSWLPMFSSDIYPAPATVFTYSDFQNTFYPISTSSFVLNNQIYALPEEVDGLALFVNEDITNPAGVKIPKNWQEFVDGAVKVTIKDASGKIQTAGAALGTANNVDNWPDIVGLLLLQQPGVDIKKSNPNIATPAVAEVLSFYTGFVKDRKRKTWDASLPPSTEMFASGKLAFYLAPSWRAYDLRLVNPNLKFKVAPVPQLSGQTVSWGTFWGNTVALKSQHPKESWEFIKYLTSAQAEKLMYQEASKVRLFGKPYSRVDLQSELSNDPIVGAFVTQGPIYKSWYLNSNTFDVGINDEMIKYWEDGVNATLSGTDPQIALQTVEQGVHQVLDKYTKAQVVPAK